MAQRSTLTRRDLIRGAFAMLPVIKVLSAPGAFARQRGRGIDLDDIVAELAAIERRIGGRLGVAMLDTASGAHVEYRGGERFAMCSTSKFLACSAVLARVDAGRESLERRVAYGESELLDYAPITKQHAKEGAMTVSALCAAAMEYSDNTAANLLLRQLGGPSAVTRYARSVGDRVTRLDRTEPTLNTALPGDPRDTTSPSAMLGDMKAILLGKALSAKSRATLIGWMEANTTGGTRLRAGFPAGWRVGDKTGTGERGATGDIAVAWPAGRGAVLVTSYLMGTGATESERSGAIREVGKAVSGIVGR